MDKISSESRRWFLLLFAVTTLAFLLRGFAVDQYLLQVDEGNRLHMAMLTTPFLSWLKYDMVVRMQSRVHSSLYLVFVRLTVAAGGSPVLAIRLPSVISGVLTVPAVFVLWRRRSRAEAIVAAAIIAVVPYHVFYSRMGWHQVAMTLWFVLGLLLFERGYFSRAATDGRALETWRAKGIEFRHADLLLVLAGGAFLIGYLFHETIIMMLVPTGLFVLWDQYPNLDRRIVALCAGLVPFVLTYAIWPLHRVVARQNADRFAVEASLFHFFFTKGNQMLENVLRLFNIVGSGPVFGGRTPVAYLTLPVVVFGVIGIWSFIRRGKPFERFLLFAAGLYIPGITFLHFGAHKPRFHLVLVPIVALLAARGIRVLATAEPMVSFPRAYDVISAAVVLFLLIYTIQSLFVASPVVGYSDDLNDRYQSRLNDDDKLVSFVERQLQSRGEVTINRIGGAEPRFHLWSYRSRIDYVGLADEPDIVVAKPWVIDSSTESLLQRCYERKLSSGKWHGYVSNGSCSELDMVVPLRENMLNVSTSENGHYTVHDELLITTL